jgi:hypothetical protein
VASYVTHMCMGSRVDVDVDALSSGHGCNIAD